MGDISIKISVIIPVHNRASTITRAIKSVLNQVHPADEIIVVDDGSDDGTSEILVNFGQVIKLIRQENRGVSAARNAGIRAAIGNWIAFLDSDDEWLPEKLQNAENFIIENPGLFIFQSEEIWNRRGRMVNPRKKHRKVGGSIFKECIPLCIVSPSATLIHRDVLEKIGYFDESLPVCEDYDLWLRVARHYSIGFDPKPGIIKYGGHEDQLSFRYWGMDRFRIIALEKQYADPELPAQLRKCVLDEIIKKLELLIKGYSNRGKDFQEYKEKLYYYLSKPEKI